MHAFTIGKQKQGGITFDPIALASSLLHRAVNFSNINHLVGLEVEGQLVPVGG